MPHLPSWNIQLNPGPLEGFMVLIQWFRHLRTSIEHIMQWAIIFMLVAIGQPAFAIHKCTVEGGKIVYQDATCDTSATKVEVVKTWDSTGKVDLIEPDLNLAGPPHAKPMLEMYRRWADAERLAGSTPRVAMSGPIATIQAIQRESEALTVESCLMEAKKALVVLVKLTTEEMLQFMAGREKLSSITFQFQGRPKLIRNFETQFKKASCS